MHEPSAVIKLPFILSSVFGAYPKKVLSGLLITLTLIPSLKEYLDYLRQVPFRRPGCKGKF